MNSISYCEKSVASNAFWYICMASIRWTLSAFHRVQWLHFTGEVDTFIMIWCDVSAGFCVKKVTKIGSFFSELFLKSQGVIVFLADRTIGRAFGTLCRLSVVCRLSVTFCIVVKRHVLAKNCLEWIRKQGQKVDLGVAAIFLLPVSPLGPPRRPFLPYFCPYSPAIGTRWYKWTFWQQTMWVLSDCVVRIETGSSFSHDYWPRKG